MDGNCGKTSLLYSLTHKRFLGKYLPTVLDHYGVEVDIDGQQIQLVLWDSKDLRCCNRARSLNYADTDVIIMCFSVVYRKSFKNIWRTWYPEVKHYLPNIPIVLVGNKSDLCSDHEIAEKFYDEVTSEEGYQRCSAKSQDGVHLLLEIVANASLSPKVPKMGHISKRPPCFCGVL